MIRKQKIKLKIKLKNKIKKIKSVIKEGSKRIERKGVMVGSLRENTVTVFQTGRAEVNNWERNDVEPGCMIFKHPMVCNRKSIHYI